MLARPSLTIKRRLPAPAARVFAAWTVPEKMVRWWGPERLEASHAEADPRVGGRFRVVFKTDDGEEHDVGGVYREVRPVERLVFTWAWRTMPERESLVTVTMTEEGGATLLTLKHERFADEAARDRHRTGWEGALANLERALA